MQAWLNRFLKQTFLQRRAQVLMSFSVYFHCRRVANCMPTNCYGKSRRDFQHEYMRVFGGHHTLENDTSLPNIVGDELLKVLQDTYSQNLKEWFKNSWKESQRKLGFLWKFVNLFNTIYLIKESMYVFISPCEFCIHIYIIRNISRNVNMFLVHKMTYRIEKKVKRIFLQIAKSNLL